MKFTLPKSDPLHDHLETICRTLEKHPSENGGTLWNKIYNAAMRELGDDQSQYAMVAVYGAARRWLGTLGEPLPPVDQLLHVYDAEEIYNKLSQHLPDAVADVMKRDLPPMGSTGQIRL